mgnify:CR=1 FL=1
MVTAQPSPAQDAATAVAPSATAAPVTGETTLLMNAAVPATLPENEPCAFAAAPVTMPKPQAEYKNLILG